jgi:DNA-binding CsgD family transcriptional regulator
MADLTERQQQIKSRYDADKTPPEIAAELGITVNAVYQHLRRMKVAKAKGKTETAKVKAPVAAKTPARRGRPPKVATQAAEVLAAAVKTPAPVAATPLQAIRARMADILATHREMDAAVSASARALKLAQEQAAKAKGKTEAELAQLRTAEAALTQKPIAPQTVADPTVVITDATVTVTDAPDLSEKPKARNRTKPAVPAPNGNGGGTVEDPPALAAVPETTQ